MRDVRSYFKRQFVGPAFFLMCAIFVLLGVAQQKSPEEVFARPCDTELEKGRISGTVVDAEEKTVPDAWVMVGDWLFDPPLISDKKGAFSVERKVARHDLYSFRYCLAYAEAFDRYLAGLGVARVDSNGQCRLTIRLSPMGAIVGRVIRSSQVESPPVEKNGEEKKDGGVYDANVLIEAQTGDDQPVRVPYALILPRIRTDINGGFCVSNLVAGLHYRLGAQKEGFQPEGRMDVVLKAGVTEIPNLLMKEQEKLFISGRVTGETGEPLWSRVTVFSMPPGNAQLGTVRTGPDGRYRVDYLPRSKVIVRAECDGYGTRNLGGILTGSDSIHFVLKKNEAGTFRPDVMTSGADSVSGAVTAAAARGVSSGFFSRTDQDRAGRQAPELALAWVNVPELALASLRGNVVLISFWSGLESAHPPSELTKLYEKYRGRGLVVVCVRDHSGYVRDVASLIEKEGINYPVGIDTYSPGAGDLNSLTMSRYGGKDGEIALISRDGIIAWMGNVSFKDIDFKEENSVAALAGTDLVEKIEALLAEKPHTAAEASQDAGEAASGTEADSGVDVGMPALELSVGRWIRGNPVSGGPVRLAEARGRVVILHFASVYVAASTERGNTDFHSYLEQVCRLYGKDSVAGVWILPSSDGQKDAEVFAARRYGDIPVGIDDAGATCRAYGVTELSENCVIDRDGIIKALRVPDAALFRVVKDVLMSNHGIETRKTTEQNGGQAKNAKSEE